MNMSYIIYYRYHPYLKLYHRYQPYIIWTLFTYNNSIENTNKRRKNSRVCAAKYVIVYVTLTKKDVCYIWKNDRSMCIDAENQSNRQYLSVNHQLQLNFKPVPYTYILSLIYRLFGTMIENHLNWKERHLIPGSMWR